MSARALLLTAALAAGCTPSAVLMTPPPTVNPPPDGEAEVTGGVSFSAGGLSTRVAYGPWSLSGGGLTLRYAGQGAWVGTQDGTDARFVAEQGLLTGPGTRLALVQDGKVLSIRGQWAGRAVDVQIGPQGLTGTAERNGCTISLRSTAMGEMSGTLGCRPRPGEAATSDRGTLLLGGEAALVPDVLLPQYVLALLASLPF